MMQGVRNTIREITEDAVNGRLSWYRFYEAVSYITACALCAVIYVVAFPVAAIMVLTRRR
jgi:hypothetical protein